MQIEFTVNAENMHRACRRLETNVENYPRPLNQSILFKISDEGVRITSSEICRAIAAKAQHRASVSVPTTVLHGVIRTLPYFGKKDIAIGFSRGRMRVDSMVFHNRRILLTEFHDGQRRSSY